MSASMGLTAATAGAWRRTSCSYYRCVAQGALLEAHRTLIEHSADPKQWRNPEKQEIHRRYGGSGVPLGSQWVKYQERAAQEQKLTDEDQDTNWGLVYGCGVVAALVLIGLNVMMELVEPPRAPEYVPYEAPTVASSTTAVKEQKKTPSS